MRVLTKIEEAESVSLQNLLTDGRICRSDRSIKGDFSQSQLTGPNLSGSSELSVRILQINWCSCHCSHRLLNVFYPVSIQCHVCFIDIKWSNCDWLKSALLFLTCLIKFSCKSKMLLAVTMSGNKTFKKKKSDVTWRPQAREATVLWGICESLLVWQNTHSSLKQNSS